MTSITAKINVARKEYVESYHQMRDAQIIMDACFAEYEAAELAELSAENKLKIADRIMTSHARAVDFNSYNTDLLTNYATSRDDVSELNKLYVAAVKNTKVCREKRGKLIMATKSFITRYNKMRNVFITCREKLKTTIDNKNICIAPAIIGDYTWSKSDTNVTGVVTDWMRISAPDLPTSDDKDAYLKNYHLTGNPDTMMELLCVCDCPTHLPNKHVINCYPRKEIIYHIMVNSIDLAEANRWYFRVL